MNGTKRRKLSEILLELICPPRCPFCGKVLEREEDGLCARCQQSLPWTDETPDRVDFCDGCFSPLHYRDGVRRGIHRYKFRGGRCHSALFGTFMAQCLSDRWSEPADGIVWVPLTRRDRRRRGYDQAELLGRSVSEATGIPVLPALEKVRQTATQSRLSGASVRRANVLGAYRVREDCVLTGKRLILVDDVTTSGATLSECAACLRMAGAESVVGLTLARAR